MSTPELVAQVREALAPLWEDRNRECPGGCEADGDFHTRSCEARLQARIAEAVAQAIQAASYGSIGKATRERVVEALAALEEVRP